MITSRTPSTREREEGGEAMSTSSTPAYPSGQRRCIRTQSWRASGHWRERDCGWRVPQTAHSMKSPPRRIRGPLPSGAWTVCVVRGGGPLPAYRASTSSTTASASAPTSGWGRTNFVESDTEFLTSGNPLAVDEEASADSCHVEVPAALAVCVALDTRYQPLPLSTNSYELLTFSDSSALAKWVS